MLTGPQDSKPVQASSTTLSEGKFFDYLVKNPHEFNPNLPKTSWDFDWDKRDPASLTPPSKNPVPSDEDPSKPIRIPPIPKPTATRHLFLIRHGQYNLRGATDDDKSLTPLVSTRSSFRI